MNTMITLENITRINNIVRANYYAESDSKDVGFIEYDLHTKRILRHEYTKNDNKYINHPSISKAVKAIQTLAIHNVFPKRYRYMWY